MIFQGLHTALITPFDKGQVDEEAYRALIERQIAAGVDGIVPAGTTGESPTLTTEEHIRVIELAVEVAAGRATVIAGTGANSTAEAVELTQRAAEVGADASMQVTPYYNKPTQKGLVEHFSAVAACTTLPIMLYSVPGRSVVEIAVETAVELAQKHSNIVSLKEAGGRTARITALRAALGKDFSLLCGDDPLVLPFLASGANGLVSVSSNLIPSEMAALVKLCLGNDLNKAREAYYDLLPLLSTLMELEVNPVPIKEAVALQGYCRSEFRLPLTNLETQQSAKLRELLENHQLLTH